MWLRMRKFLTSARLQWLTDWRPFSFFTKLSLHVPSDNWKTVEQRCVECYTPVLNNANFWLAQLLRKWLVAILVFGQGLSNFTLLFLTNVCQCSCMAGHHEYQTYQFNSNHFTKGFLSGRRYPSVSSTWFFFCLLSWSTLWPPHRAIHSRGITFLQSDILI